MDKKLLRLIILILTIFTKYLISSPTRGETTKKSSDSIKNDGRNPSENSTDHQKFDYNEKSPYGPSKWPGLCRSGRSQSPISINQGRYVRKFLNPTINITFDDANFEKPKMVKVVNNGHGVTYTLIFNDSSTSPKISGGILGKEVYQFANFHMHWPCEHSFMLASSCALEVHLVHINVKYKTLNEAMSKSDGLAVIGLLYISTNRKGLTTLPFIPMIRNVIDARKEFNETDPSKIFSYHDIIHLRNAPRIVSYNGSLTVPGCPESVTWLIFIAPHLVLNSDLRQLRQLRNSNGENVLKNNRPTQPLNRRPVYLYAPFR